MNTLRRLAIAALIAFLAFRRASATSHIFLKNKDGVWLGSDTLVVHFDGKGGVSRSHRCKVVITKGRFIFDAGEFRDVKLLMEQEKALPLRNMDLTEKAILEYLSTNHQDLRNDPHKSKYLLVVNTGVVQVRDGLFEARMFGQTDELKTQRIDIKTFLIGVPHGYGKTIDAEKYAAAHDPKLAAVIAGDPKAQLLKMLKEEAKRQPEQVAGPFTILLLRPNGTVSDFSDHPVCKIPATARYFSK